MKSLTKALVWVRTTRQGTNSPDEGAVTMEYLSWAAVTVVAIAAVGVLLQGLGVNVVEYVRGQIGL